MKTIFLRSFFISLFLIGSLFFINSTLAEIPLPTSKQSFSYPPILSPVLSDDPSEAKPFGVGSVSVGGDMLSLKIGLNQFFAPMDVFGAYIASFDPNNVKVLNSDGATFNTFTISQIANALSTGISPVIPWKANITGPIDDTLFNIPISSLPSGTYTAYLLLTEADSLTNYYLWSTYFIKSGQNPVVTISECISKVSQNKILEAKNICEAVAENFGDTVSHDADTARFFAALTQVAALWYDMASDGNPENGLNSFGDILDGFGCSQFGGTPLDANFICPDQLPFDSPTGIELQAYMNNVVKPVIEDAIDYLEDISQTFDQSWIEPLDGATVESDFGDVLALKSLYKFMLASIIIGNSYNNDIDIDNASNAPHIEALLEDNPDFLKLSDTAGLPKAQNLLSEASDDILAAISWIQSETDGQNNDWINILDVTADEIEEAKVNVNTYKASLTGSVLLDNGTLNLSHFFTGIDLRGLIPPFNGDIPGFFPDPTFDNVWTNWNSDGNPNQDVDNNGIPDILE